MSYYREDMLPAGWSLEQVYDWSGDRGWVVFDERHEPMVHEFTKERAINEALEYALEKQLSGDLSQNKEA